MKLKRCKIPVKAYVFEYALARWGYDENIGLRAPRTLSAYHHVKKTTVERWFADKSKPVLWVLSPYSSKGQLYYLAKFVEAKFHDHFLGYVEAKTDAGVKATDAIRAFCDLYKISEDHFPINTAKVCWHRYKNRKIKPKSTIE